MSLDATAPTSTAPRTGWASLRDLNRYQWFVFVVAAIAWMADCMDQQFFNLARVMSLTDLLGGANADPDAVKMWGGRATSVFLIGWATGGLVFGMYGDRIGRVRTLTYTILLYSTVHRAERSFAGAIRLLRVPLPDRPRGRRGVRGGRRAHRGDDAVERATVRSRAHAGPLGCWQLHRRALVHRPRLAGS